MAINRSRFVICQTGREHREITSAFWQLASRGAQPLSDRRCYGSSRVVRRPRTPRETRNYRKVPSPKDHGRSRKRFSHYHAIHNPEKLKTRIQEIRIKNRILETTNLFIILKVYEIFALLNFQNWKFDKGKISFTEFLIIISNSIEIRFSNSI